MTENIQETQIVAGDIFFQSGLYKKKLNYKTASNINKTEEIIDLTKFSHGEPWKNVAITYGLVGIDKGTIDITQGLDIEIQFLDNNKNVFKFIVLINNIHYIDSHISISWLAREEIVDIKGERVSTQESGQQNQSIDITLKHQAENILNVSCDNGSLTYSVNADNTIVYVNLKNGLPYKIYNKEYTYEELSQPGSYSPVQSKLMNKTLYYDSFLGYMEFSGNVSLIQNEVKPQAWIIGEEFKYKSSEPKEYAPGDEFEVNSTADVETKKVVTRSVWVSKDGYSPYHNRYDIYVKPYTRTILRDCIWKGILNAPSYLYIVDISYVVSNLPPITDLTAQWIDIEPEVKFIERTDTPPEIGSTTQYEQIGYLTTRYKITKIIPVVYNIPNHYYQYFDVYAKKQQQIQQKGV